MLDKKKNWTATTWVQPLHSALSTRQSQVGSKAARLAEMALHGFPVPPGLVITVPAFETFLADNGISLGAGFTSESVRRAILQGKFNSNLAEAILGGIRELGLQEVAVRSSALGEDGMSFSMAGQLSTFLRVPATEVLPRVKECWAGLFSDRVLAYRQGGRLSTPIGMGVILQEQIQARYAGVAFSLDPRLLSTDQLVVEWVEGLGEALVSGQVTPVRLCLRRKSPVLPEDTPGPLALGLGQLLNWMFEAEKLFGHPLDVEWGLDDGGLHMLQARPITGLLGQDLVLWSNVNIGENYPHPLSSFTWSVVEPFRYGYFNELFRQLGLPSAALAEAGPIIRNLIGIHGGRVYYNLSNWYEMLALFPLTRWFRRFLDHYIGQQVPFTYVPRRSLLPMFRERRLFHRHLWFWLQLGWNYLRLQHRVTAFEARFSHCRRGWRSRPLAECSLDRLEGVLRDMVRFLNKEWGRAALADFAAMIFPGMLELLARKWLGDSSGNLTAQLLRGIAVKSTEGSKAIWELARQIDERPPLRRLLLSKDYTALERSLDPDLRNQVQHFMENYGGRCYHELMITSPTFEERHDLFWDLARNYCLALHQNPWKKESAEAQNREGSVSVCLRRLRPWRRLLFKKVLRDACLAIQLRERVRLCQSLIYGELRRVALELGNRLAALEYLENPEEVFLLTSEEICHLCQGKFLYPETLPGILRLRREASSAAGDREPPEFFLMPRGHFWKDYQEASSPDTRRQFFQGFGVSGGRAVGRVRIVLDPSRDKGIQPGEILVARTTDPGWTPLFMVAGGLVLEKGGLLSHGAIVAREFGIPAVVGVEGATRLLQDGQTVLVDGGLGQVTVMENDEALAS